MRNPIRDQQYPAVHSGNTRTSPSRSPPGETSAISADLNGEQIPHSNISPTRVIRARASSSSSGRAS
jgi:hypothetical protein